jgi:hypothetical protein
MILLPEREKIIGVLVQKVKGQLERILQPERETVVGV